MPLPMYGSSQESKPDQAVKHTIAVASGKGGVGKSTVSVNLALSLKRKGFSVGLMDTDIYGPSIRKMLPEDRMPAQKGNRLSPALSRGIRLMSMAYFRREDEAAVIRAPIANGVISQFVQQVDWGELDFLIIDFPPGTGDIQLTLCQQANITGAVMVTTPQEIAVMDVRKSMHLFQQVNVPVLGVVENMSGFMVAEGTEEVFPFGKGGGERLARESGVPFLGAIPIDPVLCAMSDRGESIFSSSSPASGAFNRMTDNVISQLDALKKPGLSKFELVWKEMSL
jgi:ATP-binding protein involved in chromosome partitioning